ncbi:15205_t:CDS:1, partial [Funneliformis caledonium]
MREKHKLSGYFLILDKKSNRWNNFAVCMDCIRVLGLDEAQKQKFINTKRTCAKHLEVCPYFAEKHTKEEITNIINEASIHGSKKNNKRQYVINETSDGEKEEFNKFGTSNLNNFFYKSPSITRSHTSETSNISYQSFGPLDNYMYRELKPEQVDMFEHLILNVTVACGLPFSWVENSATKSLFKWINPMLPLP